MAKGNISLDIGTTYRGEGFKKLDAALRNSTGNTKRATAQWASIHKSAAKASIGAWTEFYSKIKIVTGAIKAAWNGLKLVISKPFAFETQTRQFKTLVGSIDEAKAHMADLKELGDTPPFSLDEFARASRQMMVMTDGALGFKESLKLVGDAAAATGNDIETIGHSVGRLYALIRDGEPIGRAAMELRNMGILTPEVVRELKEMQEAGASSVEIWGKVEEALSRYNGAMEETETTGNGLIGAISSRWDNIVRQFGDAFTDTAKGGMKDVLDAMEQMEQSGFANWLGQTVMSVVVGITNAVTKLYTHLKEGADYWREFFGGARDGAEEAEEAIERELQSEERINDWKTKRTYRRSDGGIEEEYEVDETKKRAAEEKERKEQALREADEKRAAESARREAEAQAKKDEEERRRQDEARRKKEEDDWNLEVQKRRNAQEFVEAYERDRAADESKERKERIQKRLTEEQERGAEEQRKLNERLEKAQGAVQDWIANLNGNRHLDFADFNKAKNQAAKDNAVQIGVDADGNPIAIDKRQANKVKSNRQQLDRLLKMRNPDARTRKEIERRQAFDDMFNPEKLKERQEAAEKAQKEKEAADRKMRENIEALKKMLVDNNGAAI